MPVDLKNLRKALRRLADTLADEAEHNPAFAATLADVIGPSSQPSKTNRKNNRTEKVLMDSLPDPFEMFLTQGMEGLNIWLAGLSFEQLRFIVRKHRFDPARVSAKWKEGDKEHFIALIGDRVGARSKQGEAFRHYGSQDREAETTETSS